MRPKEGSRLRGRYQIISSLGGGGGGETYIAEDIDRPHHPRCVVKRFRPNTTDPHLLEITRKLFYQEAEILEELGKHHNQIPTLLAHFEEDREFYLVQDFIEGQPLSVELPPKCAWSELKVIELLQGILNVLQFVHSQNVIHRDVKPANIIRQYQDRKLVLIDFGAVKQIRDPSGVELTRLNPTTISIGTEGYMPIEQMRGRPRPSSDLYALGMIGIQALTGISPTKSLSGNPGFVRD